LRAYGWPALKNQDTEFGDEYRAKKEKNVPRRRRRKNPATASNVGQALA
jgi:hypothetical protein